jgi:hypothetical protein
VLKKDYIITVDREATKYIGLTIEWDYDNGKVHIHMPGYLDKAMKRFKHHTPLKIQNSPHRHIDIKYGAKKQFVEETVESPPLSNEDGKYIQAVLGTLLYYGRAVDPTILPALSSIATEQVKPTEKTREKIQQLLDYCATQEEAIITFNASKMILCIHSDKGYANEKNARSRAGGHFFLSNNDQFPPNNGAILTTATIIKAVMSSAAEAELGALFLNAKEGIYSRQILTKMGHPQPRTPIQTENTTGHYLAGVTYPNPQCRVIHEHDRQCGYVPLDPRTNETTMKDINLLDRPLLWWRIRPRCRHSPVRVARTRPQRVPQ